MSDEDESHAAAPSGGVKVEHEVPHVSREDLAGLRSGDSSRLFHSRGFRRLWSAQVISSLGDWIGLVAILAIARRLGGGNGGSATALVLVARITPGFFLGPVVGVLVDRVNRRLVMMTCDVIRAGAILSLVYVHSLWQLVLVQLVIELATLAWAASKEASVPSLVEKEYLPTANSLSMLASYGTFPVGAAIYALLSVVASLGRQYLPSIDLAQHQQQLALAVDSITYVASALLVVGLPIVAPARNRAAGSQFESPKGNTWADIKEGMSFIRTSPRIRAVMFGMATGIMGGGMIIPLADQFTQNVLYSKGNTGYGVLQSALGFGMAIGVITLTFVQKRLNHERVFLISVFGAGICIFLASSSWTLGGASLFIGLLGLCSGGVYVLGFTIIQSDSVDELRGRTFAAFYTLMRVCLLIGLIVAPILSDRFQALSQRFFKGQVHFGHHLIRLQGVRVTLWLGAAIILGAGFIAFISFGSAHRLEKVKESA